MIKYQNTYNQLDSSKVRGALEVPSKRVNTASNRYKQYLKSPHWLEVRMYFWANKEWECYVCGLKTNELDIHHRSYKRLGKEKDSDLMFLCRECHTTCHAILKSYLKIGRTTNTLGNVARKLRYRLHPEGRFRTRTELTPHRRKQLRRFERKFDRFQQKKRITKLHRLGFEWLGSVHRKANQLPERASK